MVSWSRGGMCQGQARHGPVRSKLFDIVVILNIIHCRYVDFGNFELTPVYNLRRLLPEFIEELPVLAIPVSLPVVFNNTNEKDFVFPELIKNILYQEMKLKVISVSPNGQVLVSLRTREEDARVEKFIRILKDECSYS